MSSSRIFCVAATLAASSLLVVMPAHTQQQATVSQQEPAILTFVMPNANGRKIDLSRADIERLPTAVIRTTTPWHDGVQIFEGVKLAELLAHLRATGKVINVVALNGYRTQIPVTDADVHGPILALRRNGEPMSVRDKGPLFIIYPFDSDPALRTETYLSRSAWQVRSMAIE